MDKTEHYRGILRRVIQEYATIFSSKDDVETRTIIDSESDDYAVISIGWEGVKRVHHYIVHLNIQNGKIWIQYDGTNLPIADELLEAGVPKEDIVLGIHPANLRQHTGFGVG